MPKQRTTLHVTHGAITTGHWCDTCMTSSAYSARAYALSPTTLTAYPIGTFTGCTTCDPHDDEDGDEVEG
jgi:hypothetical protein